MDQKKPIVSVILPTYNGREEWIKKSIESVLDQTFTNFEFIIINDCSTNGIESTILKYVKMDNRILYIKNEKNLKITGTLNKALNLAKGKYIARADDDDIWDNVENLKRWVEFLEKHVDYGLCGAGKVTEIDEDGKTIKKVDLKCSDEELRNSLLGCTQFVHSGILIRKSIFDEVGVYDPKWNTVEDYELWLRIGTKSKLANLNNTSIKRRINYGGISKTNKKRQKKLSRMLFFKYGKRYPKFFRALFLRIGEIIVCDRYKDYILGKLKKWGL